MNDVIEQPGLWGNAWRQLRRQPLAMLCLAILVVYVGVWVYAEATFWSAKIRGVTPAYKISNYDQRNLSPSREHPLGTNFAGRDNLNQIVQGTRIAFEIGLLTSVIVIPLGFALGAVAGYFGRKVDTGVVYLYSVVDSVPGILLILAIAYVVRSAVDRSVAMQTVTRYVDSGLLAVCVGMGFTGWVGLCRLIRGEYFKHRDRQYVLAARSLGASHTAIMFRHIMPNVLHLIIINFSLRFPGLILTEAVLSYLGVGVRDEPSWGAMINDAKQRLWLGNWWELGGATLAMLFLVLALNIFGDALRDALDPKLRTAEAKTG
ncbi:MAG: Dipeptide transport system permease protein DppC [Verrucomicrobiae bacterium]|nr:Dipeptide transport system permease protein DppC [Verrucomicrobiae bacterium]